MKPSLYPDDFLWGASTASHQVEGGTHNQWSEWEQQHAAQLAQTAKQRLDWMPLWPDIRKQAEDPANYISGRGVEHYTHYREDFDIMQGLGFNAFRFGIEWARVQPAEDQWDTDAIEHYHTYISELQQRGIEPVLTLWHWTMPTWFTDKGAFARADNLKYFARYVERMAAEFGPSVRYVITLNEPNVYAGFSYMNGEWPPQHRSLRQFLWVYYNLARAHRQAYSILKRANPDLQIGVAAQLANLQPKRSGSPYDRLFVRLATYGNNWWWLDRIKRHQDFIGLNYYFTNYMRGYCMDNPKGPLSDLGWYMEPGGILPLLQSMAQRYHKPIIVTENGLADAADIQRQWWLAETMQALESAIARGVPLIGYLHWSLVDNFEWKYGWWPKFGLVAVDRERGMSRTVRASARWLQNYIAALKK